MDLLIVGVLWWNNIKLITLRPHWAIDSVKGIREPCEAGKIRNLLKSMGFEPTTSKLDEAWGSKSSVIKVVVPFSCIPAYLKKVTLYGWFRCKYYDNVAISTYFFFFSFSASSYYGRYQYDSKAFLFSLVNKPGWAPVKLPQTGKYAYNKRSIYSKNNFGPIFGDGSDIFISNYASSNSYSHSNLGHTYSPPSGYSYGSTFAQTFLAGTYSFTPDEVEVFYETTKMQWAASALTFRWRGLFSCITHN